MLRVFLVFVWLALPAFAEAPEVSALRQYENLTRSAETTSSLCKASRQQVFDQVSKHPVTNVDNMAKYDPDGYIGFCFGRAMGTHLFARKLGIESASVRKLFIIGDLRSGKDPEWRFHVTTLVKGTEDGLWHAIDPIMTPPLAPGEPLPVEEWVSIVRKTWDKDGKAKLYLTSADTILPDVTKDIESPAGDAVLQLAFDPSKVAGFTAVKLGTVEAWETDSCSEADHFISVREGEADRFKFDAIAIGTLNIDYKGYFLEFLGDVSGEVPITTILVRAKAVERLRAQVRAAALSTPARPNLGSPRLDRFFPAPKPTVTP